MPKTKITGFWTFFCNPKYWAVDDFLLNADLHCISEYRITSWQKNYFEKGQLGVIRVGNDSRNRIQLKGKKRLEKGIYAIVEITGRSFQKKISNSNFKIEHQKNESGRFAVPIKYIRNYIESPILLTNIKDDHLINSDAYILKGIQAASMPLLEDTFNRILLYGEEYFKMDSPST